MTVQNDKTIHEALPFKMLKLWLKFSMGPPPLFTLEIIETLISKPLLPEDYKTIAKTCLSGGDYLL
jgi:hypothetical protein